MDFFKKKPTVKEIAKDTKKTVKKEQRDIDREYSTLERQEKQVTVEIKKRAKTPGCSGKTDTILVTLSRQLIQIRQAKERMISSKAQIGAMGLKAQGMASQMAVADSMKSVSAVMGKMNASVNMSQLQQQMRSFEMENEKMNITEEMMGEALSDAFDNDEIETEADNVTNQVLAELGLELDGQMSSAPSSALPVTTPVVNADADADADADFEAMLARNAQLNNA